MERNIETRVSAIIHQRKTMIAEFCDKTNGDCWVAAQSWSDETVLRCVVVGYGYIGDGS